MTMEELLDELRAQVRLWPEGEGRRPEVLVSWRGASDGEDVLLLGYPADVPGWWSPDGREGLGPGGGCLSVGPDGLRWWRIGAAAAAGFESGLGLWSWLRSSPSDETFEGALGRGR